VVAKTRLPAKKSPAKKKATKTKKAPEKPQNKRGSTGKRYPKELWAECQTEFESGKYKSLKEMFITCGQLVDNYPSLSALDKRCTKYKWVAKREEVYASIADKNRALFIKLGMTDEKAVGIMIEGMTGGTEVLDEIVKKMADNDTGLIDLQSIELIKQYLSSCPNRKGFVEMYHKMLGNYTARKTELTGKGGGPLRTKSEDLSKEDLANELKRMRADSPDITGVINDLMAGDVD